MRYFAFFLLYLVFEVERYRHLAYPYLYIIILTIKIEILIAPKLLLFIYLFTLFYFTILYWFCHISTWICHGCTRVPNPEPPSHLPPHTISLVYPSAPAPSILYPASNLDWRFVSYMILYMFQCHSPKSSHPRSFPQSPKDIYICVSFAVSHTGLLLPSF